MPLVKQHNTWAQAAGKGLNIVGNGPSNSNTSEMENDQDNSGGSATKVMKMEENVNETTLAAAYSEGWGQRGVNQDTAWDVPSSPHLSPKEGSTWTNSTSSGTEIWENNVRHHIKSANAKTPNQVREPWSHTPTTHIGGTWGEEEDTTNLWTGVPQASGATWGGESNTSVWGAANPPENKNWSNQNNPINPNMNPNWNNEPPALQIGLPHIPLANENKNIAALQIGLPHMPLTNDNKNLAEDNGPDNTPPWADPSHKSNRTFTNWSPVTGGNKKMPPSGWEETAPPPVTCPSGGNYDDGTAVWGNPVHQGKVSHWKEMPPAKQMQNCVMPPNNMCQGGNPCAPHTGPGMIRLPQTGSNINNNDKPWMKNPILNRNMSWNEMQSHRDPLTGRRIFDLGDNQLPDKNVPGTPNTPNSAFANWGEPTHSMGPHWGAKSKNSNCSWADGQVDTSSWGGPLKQSGKPLTKDLIWASKQFRILMEMNFKKDDIENALRRSNMNIEEALLELHALNNKDGPMLDIDGLSSMNLNQPRVHLGNVSDDMNFTDHSLDSSLPPGNMYGNNFPGMNMFSTGFNTAQNCKTQNSVGNNITPILGSAGTNNQVPNFNLNNGINNLSPAMMRKLLEQTQTFNPACLPQNTGRMNQQNFSSSAQLRLLVQQIQMAVQAGHVNPTILNQPLAPQTLCFLFQLLQQIKVLHQLQQQQMYFSQHGSKPGSPPLQLSVQITQTKQHIMNLQNQIAAQQAVFLKQQVQLPVQHPSLQNPQPSSFDVVKSNLESINGLHSEFRDLSMKEPPSQSHSRLTQWKMPSFDKEDNPASNESNSCNRDNSGSSSEFSRAPGSITKSSSSNSLSSASASHSSSNLQPLSENVWPDMSRSQSDAWSDPNDSNNVQGNGDNIGNSETISDGSGSNKHNSASDNKDSPATSSNPSTSSSSQSYNLNDLVPEFEPGKPWKGTSRIKNFEDDPHVTPGSIAKSPLSLNSIKDSELFTWNTKQNVPNLTSSSLTSSTWTFSPPPSQNSGNSSGKSGNSRSWGNQPSEQDRMPWKGPTQMPKTSRPPPGLSGQNKPITSNWRNNDGVPQGWSSNAGWEKQGGSNFLVLKNLTPQRGHYNACGGNGYLQ